MVKEMRIEKLKMTNVTEARLGFLSFISNSIIVINK